MNCENCGAAMELNQSRRYFQCPYCGTLAFPEPIDADGIRIVGRTPDALRCPVCRAGMDQAVLDTDYPVSFCGRCRGVLLPRLTFARVVNNRRAWETDPPVQPPPLDRRALDRKLACPSCGQPFMTYPYSGPGNVVIDNCAKCDLIWLDFGEMRQIVDAPGKDRGSRQVIPVDDEYVRQGPERKEDPAAEENPLSFLINLLKG